MSWEYDPKEWAEKYQPSGQMEPLDFDPADLAERRLKFDHTVEQYLGKSVELTLDGAYLFEMEVNMMDEENLRGAVAFLMKRSNYV